MRKSNFSAILIFCAAILDESHSKRRSRCSECPPGWGVKAECMAHSDTKCERCTLGETYSPDYSHKSPCWPCSRCGVGLYEARECTRSADTVCGECTAVLDRPEVRENRRFDVDCSYLFLSGHGRFAVTPDDGHRSPATHLSLGHNSGKN